MKTKKGRLILIPTTEKTGITLGDNITRNIPGDFRGQNYQLILVSLENDKIEVGDLMYKADIKGNLYKHIPTDNVWYKDAKKVIATQSQLSESYIQKFIQQYNADKVEDVEIEMEEDGDVELQGREYINYSPKLINGFITFVKEEQYPILYTEEEVQRFVFKAYNQRTIDDKVRSTESLMNWFNQNKKK